MGKAERGPPTQTALLLTLKQGPELKGHELLEAGPTVTSHTPTVTPTSSNTRLVLLLIKTQVQGQEL